MKRFTINTNVFLSLEQKPGVKEQNKGASNTLNETLVLTVAW